MMTGQIFSAYEGYRGCPHRQKLELWGSNLSTLCSSRCRWWWCTSGIQGIAPSLRGRHRQYCTTSRDMGPGLFVACFHLVSLNLLCGLQPCACLFFFAVCHLSRAVPWIGAAVFLGVIPFLVSSPRAQLFAVARNQRQQAVAVSAVNQFLPFWPTHYASLIMRLLQVLIKAVMGTTSGRP